jgi:hypothetical protein
MLGLWLRMLLYAVLLYAVLLHMGGNKAHACRKSTHGAGVHCMIALQVRSASCPKEVKIGEAQHKPSVQ